RSSGERRLGLALTLGLKLGAILRRRYRRCCRRGEQRVELGHDVVEERLLAAATANLLAGEERRRALALVRKDSILHFDVARPDLVVAHRQPPESGDAELGVTGTRDLAVELADLVARDQSRMSLGDSPALRNLGADLRGA